MRSSRQIFQYAAKASRLFHRGFQRIISLGETNVGELPAHSACYTASIKNKLSLLQ